MYFKHRSIKFKTRIWLCATYRYRRRSTCEEENTEIYCIYCGEIGQCDMKPSIKLGEENSSKNISLMLHLHAFLRW